MKYKVTLNDKTYEVIVEKGQAILADEYDAIAPAAAAPVAAAPVAAPAAAPAAAAAPVVTGAGDPVTAPLPGTVVDIKVTQGQAVKSGDVVAIIEAMKMENEVMAPKDGTVTQVVASKGAAVKTGDPLVMLG